MQQLKHRVAGFLFVLSIDTSAQVVQVENSPRRFSVIAPTSWIRQPTTTGNSRVKFVSPPKTPYAECAVIVQQYHQLRDMPQSYFNQQMLEPPDARELAASLANRYSNVKVLSVGPAALSGYSAHLSNVIFSTGTPDGEQWSRSISLMTGTTPGLTWTVACGAVGKSLAEAERGFKYWQMEMNRFAANVKIN
ncbi:MAG: hypothetical protein NTV11_18010 [Rhodocyclales bacterium]|nr:hypothetical protein [Rhodocyclales bacterium]